MKTMLSLGRRHYLARISTFLIVIALIAGMIGCSGGGLVEYGLTIAGTAGGSVTTPGEGTFAYDEVTVVNLVAEAEEGYRFQNWSGDAESIADVNAASTTITMNDNCSITANFIAQYTLTIDSTDGGHVTTPGEGTFTYDAGTVVNPVAQAEQGYHFVNWTGDIGSIRDVGAATTSITINGDHSIVANFMVSPTPMVAGGEYHTVAVKSDGSVVAVGHNISGECNVGGWRGITQVAAGDWHTVGLKFDGTVVAVGSNSNGQCDVNGWTNITQVAAGDGHTVGLKSDGTVVAVGCNDYGQCNVNGWRNITQVAVFAGAWTTVGLKSDGTVVAAGRNDEGQCEVGNWIGIVQVASYTCTVGLKADGTVVVAGAWWDEHCDVGGWTNITQVAAGAEHTVGLKADGTVVAVGRNDDGECDVSDWVDIIQVAAGAWHTVGLENDGTVVAVGNNDYGQCDVSDWTLK